MTVTWHSSDGRADNNCTNELYWPGQVHIWFRTSADAMSLVGRASASQISRQPLQASKEQNCIKVLESNFMLKEYNYTLLSYQNYTLQDGYKMICWCLLRRLWSSKPNIGFCTHLHFSMCIFSTRIFDFLRASSNFYAHLQHDQDFPSDTRPRDDPASRLAPGHALVTPPFGLTVATLVAGPLQSCMLSCLLLPSDLLHLCQ